MQRRIKRDYRSLPSSPARFLGFCQKVKRGITGNQSYPDSIWGANGALRQQYFEAVDRLEVIHHQASDGARSVIRERDKLSEEICAMLDEIALLLEAASVRNPDALFTTGFSVTQERRIANRTRLPLQTPDNFVVVNSGDHQGQAVGSASAMPGAFNHEIHINQKDPSVEADWFHKAIYPNATEMIMDNIIPGNTFFRMRHHGPDGPGPWSAVISTIIT